MSWVVLIVPSFFKISLKKKTFGSQRGSLNLKMIKRKEILRIKVEVPKGEN